MSGNYSRRKGLKNEYLVRDALRAEGFTADRVPSSGAAEGFKGDIKFGKDGRTWLAEVKVRGGVTFKNIYEFFNQNAVDGIVSFSLNHNGKLWCIDLADSMEKVMRGEGFYKPLTHKGAIQTTKLFPLLGASDFLIIRNDHKQFLYIRYRV